MSTRLMHAVRRAISDVAARISPVRWKQYHELRYWKGMRKAEGRLANHHYQFFYTAHFGLEESRYRDQVLLDLGCGPRGSLEWASMARRRIGVDPLANQYLRLGADRHRMEYIAAPAERIPLPASACDAVFSFNSLDHVEDVDHALREVKRVTRPGGLFLLLVEVNHPPTACEPHTLGPAPLVQSLRPEFDCEDLRVYRPNGNGMYESILAGARIADPEATEEVGYLSARFVRTADAAGAR
jgi:SAM-dependent methyltransferase